LSSQNPRETVGEEPPGLGGTRDVVGIRTSRRALAPQLILRTNGLVGLAFAGSVSSIALSSAVDVAEETEETEPRRREKPGWGRGGEVPLTLIRL